MKNIFAALYVILLSIPSHAETLYSDGFARRNPADYIEDYNPSDNVRIDSIDQKIALLVIDTRVRMNRVPVSPASKYTLSFTGSFRGDVESIEENPRFDIFTQPGQRNSLLPSREVEFLDDANQTIGRMPILGMPFKEKHEYTDVFYTPSGTKFLRLHIASGAGVTFVLQNLKLNKPKEEDAINANPTFSLGPLNYSGWQRVSAGGRIIEHEGKVVFDTKYGSRGCSIPINRSGTYALSAKAVGNGYNTCVILELFDSEGKAITRSVLRNFKTTNYFVPPKETASASLLVYSCLLEEVHLVRVGDEQAINQFRD